MVIKKSHRADRVAQLVHREIATTISRHVEKPLFSEVTITAVKMSRDLTHARVYFTILGDADDAKINEAERNLNFEIKFFRQILAKNLRLRFVPELCFFYDRSVHEGAKLFALIDAAVASDELKKARD